MVSRTVFRVWVVEALQASAGSAKPLDVSKAVWKMHEETLREMPDLFFTWQYDLRWAALQLRKAGYIEPVAGKRNLPWTLTSAGLRVAPSTLLEPAKLPTAMG